MKAIPYSATCHMMMTMTTTTTTTTLMMMMMMMMMMMIESVVKTVQKVTFMVHVTGEFQSNLSVSAYFRFQTTTLALAEFLPWSVAQSTRHRK